MSHRSFIPTFQLSNFPILESNMPLFWNFSCSISSIVIARLQSYCLNQHVCIEFMNCVLIVDYIAWCSTHIGFIVSKQSQWSQTWSTLYFILAAYNCIVKQTGHKRLKSWNWHSPGYLLFVGFGMVRPITRHMNADNIFIYFFLLWYIIMVKLWHGLHFGLSFIMDWTKVLEKPFVKE